MIRKPARPDGRLQKTRLAALLLGVGLLCGSTTEDASLLESRRHAIQMLSQSELNQLKRNYESYLKLSPERREQLARLHDELEQDTKNGGHLHKLLDQYNEWLFKLSPFDRDKLLGTADPGERAQEVQKVLQEQQKQRMARAAKVPWLPVLSGRLDVFAPLSSSEMDVVLKAVEQNFLNDGAKKRLADVSEPRERHLQILRLTMDQLRREREAGAKIGLRENELASTMLDAIPNDAVKLQIPTGAAKQATRRQLGQIIGRSILAEWKPELDESPATAVQIEETTNRWLASTAPERRENMQKRLQSEQGRNLIAAVSTVQSSPRFRKQRPIINWLFKGLGGGLRNRLPGTAGRAGSASKQTAAAKSTDRTTEESEKDSSSTEQ